MIQVTFELDKNIFFRVNSDRNIIVRNSIHTRTHAHNSGGFDEMFFLISFPSFLTEGKYENFRTLFSILIESDTTTRSS